MNCTSSGNDRVVSRVLNEISELIQGARITIIVGKTDAWVEFAIAAFLLVSLQRSSCLSSHLMLHNFYLSQPCHNPIHPPQSEVQASNRILPLFRAICRLKIQKSASGRICEASLAKQDVPSHCTPVCRDSTFLHAQNLWPLLSCVSTAASKGMCASSLTDTVSTAVCRILITLPQLRNKSLWHTL